jgi:uncharacterized membrane protein
MKNPLDSVGLTVTLGIAFAIPVMLLPATPGGDFSHLGLGRWLHIVSGIFWVGMLCYFNVAQIPALAEASADSEGPGGSAILRDVAPRARRTARLTSRANFLLSLPMLLCMGGSAHGLPL